MLKPKYVHGLNAEEAPASLLHRLQHGEGIQFWPLPAPDDTGNGDSAGGSNLPVWTFTFG